MVGKLFYNHDNNFLSFSILVSCLTQKVIHSKLKCGKQMFYTLQVSSDVSQMFRQECDQINNIAKRSTKDLICGICQKSLKKMCIQDLICCSKSYLPSIQDVAQSLHFGLTTAHSIS